MFIYILGIGDGSGKFGDIDRSLGLPFFWLYNVVEDFKTNFSEILPNSTACTLKNHLVTFGNLEKNIVFEKKTCIAYHFKRNVSLNLYLAIFQDITKSFRS